MSGRPLQGSSRGAAIVPPYPREYHTVNQKCEHHQYMESEPHQHPESKQTTSEHCNVGKLMARQWSSVIMLLQGPV